MSSTYTQSHLSLVASSGSQPAAALPAHLVQPQLSPMELAFRLQATLDLETILQMFSENIKNQFPHDGMSYDFTEQGLHYSLGRISRHSCRYMLKLGNQPLGEIQFLRGRKFREPELQQIELLLGGLVYPLRNALLYQQALQAAQTDPLTGLRNRAALERSLPAELAAMQRSEQSLVMLVIDLDYFKRINDSLGHSVGDDVLRATANCLRRATRQSDLIFRTGGEEFVVLLRPAEDETGLQAAERIRLTLEQCPETQQAAAGFHLTASIGLARAHPSDQPRSLFDRADRAMYMAKQAGRNRVHVAEAVR